VPLLKNTKSYTFRERSWKCALEVAGLVSLASVASLAVVRLGLPSIGRLLACTPRIERADAIAVLAGNSSRSEHGIALYNQGLAPELWHTGDDCPGRLVSPAQEGAQLALERGVPAKAIHLLASHSTWQDGQEIAALAHERQVQTILVVTDWWHSRRALSVLARHLVDSEITVYCAPVIDTCQSPENWWRCERSRHLVLRELGKIGYYWIRYGVSPF
jgi:uncharacterized SAM-binding protein YcdF (DUF218 family)